MSTTNRKGKAVIVRQAGFEDDYVAANKAELLQAEDPVTEEMVKGDQGVAHRFKTRGPVTRVVRRPHASYLLGEQNEIFMIEIEHLKRRMRLRGEEGMTAEDLSRLKDLNEMVSRNLREEREQTKLERLEDLSDEELERRMREELEALGSDDGT